MVTLPTPSLVTMCVGFCVVGVLLGRSSRAMRWAARAHSRVHDKGARVDANLKTGDQSVSIVLDASGARSAVEDSNGVAAIAAVHTEGRRESLQAGAATELPLLDAEVVDPPALALPELSDEQLAEVLDLASRLARENTAPGTAS